jgi:hypothetical protein
MTTTSSDLYQARWRGKPGRLEVWYTTITDPVSGTGFWLHHELCAPHDRSAAMAYGWAAVFPPDASPWLARFGPQPWSKPTGSQVFAAKAVQVTATAMVGRADDPLRDDDIGSFAPLSWDLTVAGGGEPLYAMPRWAWRREILPAAHVVAAPTAAYTGSFSVAGQQFQVRGWPGATSRIYGHGNARRWGWLHADLGDGEVLEVIAAVSMRPVMRRWRPLPFLKLRYRDESGHSVDWPGGDELLAARRFRADLGRPLWTVQGVVGDKRLQVAVAQPPDRSVSVGYRDPDGLAAVCHNSERASVVVQLDQRSGTGWRTEREWRLDGTAHSEIGERSLPG